MMKKRSFRQTIYESVLLAELKQNELEQNLKEKERLQQQYDKLEKQARQSKQKAESYNEELNYIKQQLAQKPSKAMIEKLTAWISNSIMEKSRKNFYIRQLSELDVDTLEQGWLTANEKISNMDMKYIICFAIDMEVQDMSLLFNVEPSSIYIVRYRIKKKFGDGNSLRLVI
jgi:ATP-dependent 26S proteasome regulatory subunit